MRWFESSRPSIHPRPVSGKEILERVFDAWRKGDALYAAAHFAVEATYQEAGRAPLFGRAAITEHFTQFFRDGPRWQFDVETIIVQPPHAAVVYRFAVEGTPGAWRERAGCAAVTFERGAITAWREYEG